MGVYVTGAALVSSLGINLRDACAAARSGFQRPEELHNVEMNDPGEGVAVPLMAYPVPLVNEGFEDDARLVNMLAYALHDLSAGYEGQLPAWLNSKVKIYLTLPAEDRIWQGVELVPDDEARETRQQAQQTWVDEQDVQPVEQRARDLLTNIPRFNFFDWGKLLTADIAVFSSGHTAVYEAMRHAQDDLLAGVVDTAVVIGLDSLLAEKTLAWLDVIERLQTPGRPMGAPASEACGIIVLEKDDTHAVAEISECLEARSKTHLYDTEVSYGQALAKVAVQGAQARVNQNQPLWLLSDNSGELWRVNELGHMLVKGLSKDSAFDAPEIWEPSVTFGDTGCAVGVVKIVTAIEAWRREYAPASEAVCLATGYDQVRRGLLLRRPA